jgi:hypothetical protein
MSPPATSVWLVAALALALVAIAWGFDLMARKMSARAARRRTGRFVYHPDHDAWVCPQDQWLWPTSFDPHDRIMRYRAKPGGCNACPVKSTCTTSDRGREVTREVDPWPYSEAGRFHRGISCRRLRRPRAGHLSAECDRASDRRRDCPHPYPIRAAWHSARSTRYGADATMS